jgi:arylsulfatase A-like enzyme/Tfp pilus assembly protein PilF
MFFQKRRILVWSVIMILVLFGSIPVAYGMSRPKDTLNIILITIDTLRADHLGCYGYDSIKTPHIDRLAKDGILFSNAYSPSPLTFPSHVSIMTGQYPIQHGIQNNGTFIFQDSANTLAEILQKMDYRTGAVVSSYVLASHFGLNQGFDDYDDYFFQKKGEIQDHSQNERIGEAVTDISKKWLQKNHKKPFFLWVHYFDPHSPYEPPPPFDNLYKEKPYDGEIAYTDKCLGVLLEEINKLSLLKNTCIIVVGDHGEGLWEHNEQTHGLFIYDTTLKVPLIISYPKRFQKGNKVASLVGTVDIMPTILEMLGVKSEEFFVQGASLVHFLTEKDKDMKRDLYCESQYPKLNLNWAPLEGIVTYDGWKYIYAPKPELYNLKEDPQENKNLLSISPQKAKSLHERLLSLKKDLLEKSQALEDAKSIALSPETRERLQSLGYISYGGSSNEALEGQNDHALTDPKDKAHLLAMVDEARGLEGKGQFEQALQKYEEVLKQDPDNKMALFPVGLIYANTGKPEKALNIFQKLAEIDPKNYNTKNSLGLTYDFLGMPEKAVQAYKEALQINPKVAYIHHNLGNAYLKINTLDLAVQEFQKMRSLSQDPIVISMALGNLGGIHLRRRRFKKALKKFKESIEFNSINRDAHISLADTYYHLGKIDQSIQEWKTIIDLWPDDYIACYKLAQLLLEARKSDQAILYLKKCLRLHPEYIDARMLLQRIYQELSLTLFLKTLYG